MHVNEIPRSGAFVQIIHILRAKKEAFTNPRFKLGQRVMRPVRLAPLRITPSHGITCEKWLAEATGSDLREALLGLNSDHQRERWGL